MHAFGVHSLKRAARVWARLSLIVRRRRAPAPTGNLRGIENRDWLNVFKCSTQICAVAGRPNRRRLAMKRKELPNVKSAKGFDYRRGRQHRNGNGAATWQPRAFSRRHRHIRARWKASRHMCSMSPAMAPWRGALKRLVWLDKAAILDGHRAPVVQRLTLRQAELHRLPPKRRMQV